MYRRLADVFLLTSVILVYFKDVLTKDTFMSKQTALQYLKETHYKQSHSISRRALDEGACETTDTDHYVFEGKICYVTPTCNHNGGETEKCYDINECESNPCRHGRCHNGDNKYTCTCDPGWEGTNCQTDINECLSNRCQNGATCINGLNKYTCNCAEDFTSVNCEIDMCIISHQNGADVVFVFDLSASQSSPQIPRMKQYVTDFMSKFPIGPTYFQISIVSFSFEGLVHFYLNTHSTMASLTKAIMDIDSVTTGTSNTAAALELTLDDVFTPAKGASRSVQRYVIVLSDGLSSDMQETLKQTRRIKKAGVTVISVGIGDQVSHSELLGIASGNNMVFPAITNDAANSILKAHVMAGCPDCFRNTTDIAILMESSDHIAPEIFLTQMDAIRTLLKATSVHQDGVHVSFARFASTVHEEFPFDRYYSANEMIVAITKSHRSPLASDKANLTNVLTHVKDDAFAARTGTRTTTRKLALIFSQGHNLDEGRIKQTLKSLKDDGIIIAAVGIGKYSNLTSLLAIASDPAFVYVIGDDIYTSAEVLHALTGSLEYDVCEMD